jgi:hypothetical protein
MVVTMKPAQVLLGWVKLIAINLQHGNLGGQTNITISS